MHITLNFSQPIVNNVLFMVNVFFLQFEITFMIYSGNPILTYSSLIFKKQCVSSSFKTIILLVISLVHKSVHYFLHTEVGLLIISVSRLFLSYLHITTLS